MPLATKVVAAAPAGHATPLLAVAIPEGGFPRSLEALDRQVGGTIARLVSSRDFTGEADQATVLYPSGPATRVALVGLGKGPVTRAAVRRAAAVAARLAQRQGVDRVSFHLAGEAAGLPPAEAVQVITEGLVAGAWRFLGMKRPPDDPRPELAAAEILVAEASDAVAEGHRVGEAVAAAHVVARDLQVLPGNVCTPTHLATTATDLGRRHGIPVTVLDRAALQQEGMNALLGVAQGSVQEPRLIVLEYRGADGPPVVLVGKGITFDSGGISIKPAERMEDMKFDMSGAAAVLGTFEMLGRLKPALHVVGLVPSAENMPSGTALKPGDVVKSHFGKTIEIVNTDAEGRLILADALSYARRFKPACALDAATLTGAVVIGLGHTAGAVLGTDPDLVREVLAAGERAGERVWELPFWDEYRELNKSEIADVKNSGGRPAGTISAAWFLREFVEGFPWAHLDIAGTAYTDKETPASVKGPTAMGARLFCEFLLARR